MRGAASGAFVLGSLVAGQVLLTAPLDTIVWMHAALLGLAGLLVALVPPLDATARATPQERSPVGGVDCCWGCPRSGGSSWSRRSCSAAMRCTTRSR